MEQKDFKVVVTEYPTEKDWMEVKRRALKTMWKKPKAEPDIVWKRKILLAGHSPIRYARFSFDIELPYWVHAEIRTHYIGNNAFVTSQRNDRQEMYDRRKAPQDAPVGMIYDMNGESVITICRKRLCVQASDAARKVIAMMRDEVYRVCPEYRGILRPPCEIYGLCHEMHPCGRYPSLYDKIFKDFDKDAEASKLKEANDFIRKEGGYRNEFTHMANGVTVSSGGKIVAAAIVTEKPRAKWIEKAGMADNSIEVIRWHANDDWPVQNLFRDLVKYADEKGKKHVVIRTRRDDVGSQNCLSQCDYKRSKHFDGARVVYTFDLREEP